MHVGPIELTNEERQLWSEIKLEPKNHCDYIENKARVPKFVALLAARRAIPDHRRQCFVNPEYRTGRVKRSVQQQFEHNGTHGCEIFEHAHFLPHLRYMVLGADLPPDLVEEFHAHARTLSPITSGDLQTLETLVRRQLNARRLEPGTVADEYFRLCLDCGIYLSYAQLLRERVAGMRLAKRAV